MPHPDHIQRRLAQEEAELARTRQEILSTRERIQQAQRQVAEWQQRLSRLKEQEAAGEKRVDLLRQYMEIAPSDSDRVEPDPLVQHDEEETGYPLQEDTPSDERGAELTDFDDQLLDDTDLDSHLLDRLDDMVPSAPAPQKVPEPLDPAAGLSENFEQIDDESLSMEVLPRTQTFEEELLLILAYHRKAVEPKDVARLFRRLDHTPKIKPTEDNVRAHMSSAPHLYEQTSEGRFGLSQEGREEAQRLLMGLV